MELRPEHIYNLYTNNEAFKNCLVDTLIAAREVLKNKFKGVYFNMYGRIKSENSYMQKSVKKNQIFDIYAFKIVVRSVSDSFKSNSPDVIKAKENLKKAKKTTNIANIKAAQDDLNIAVAREITNYLVSDNSAFLEKTGTKHLDNRRDSHRKENGYISEHFTIEHPNLIAKFNLPCRIEAQVLSDYRNKLSKENHAEYKALENRPDESQVIVKNLLRCKDLQDFNNLCRGVPTYFLCKDNGDIIEFSNHASVLHFCSNYLFERNPEKNTLRYQHALDVLNKMYKDNKLLYKNEAER